MWFDSWLDIARVLGVGVVAYAFLVVTLLLSGKRALSQMNAFDFVVTVALGSTLATILLSADVSWTEGASALVLLAALQFLVAWLSMKVAWFERAVTSRATVIVDDGALDRSAMSANRLTESQVMQAIRGGGYGDVALVGAVVLETNGKLSVISKDSMGSRTALPSTDSAT